MYDMLLFNFLFKQLSFFLSLSFRGLSAAAVGCFQAAAVRFVDGEAVAPAAGQLLQQPLLPLLLLFKVVVVVRVVRC